MKSGQTFFVIALSISFIILGVLSIFAFPETVADWIVSDIILGSVLYLTYLVSALIQSTKRKLHFS